MTQIQCVVVTPESTYLDELVDFVAFTLYDGEMGIDRGHAPLIGRLGPGELRLRTGSDTKRYYVEGGLVQVADDVVSLLTSRVKPLDELDAAEADKWLGEARGLPANTDEQLAERDRRTAEARAQKRLAARR